MSSRRKAAATVPQSLRDRLAVWRELVESCGSKPTRKRVHALRVLTLRIQAEVEHQLNELPRASHQAQAMLRFEKRAVRLRRALSSVRESDVWIAKLRALSNTLTPPAGYVPRSTRSAVHQIECLEMRLKTKRRNAAEKLAREIEKSSANLMNAVTELEESVSGLPSHMNGTDADALLRDFQHVTARFPVFHEDNLHDFRKSIKKIRYSAELQVSDPACVQIAAQMRRMQTAIGEWHDWQVLAQSAERRKQDKSSELRELLASLTSEAFDNAVAVCHRASASLAALTPAIENGAIRSGAKKAALGHRPDPALTKKLA